MDDCCRPRAKTALSLMSSPHFLSFKIFQMVIFCTFIICKYTGDFSCVSVFVCICGESLNPILHLPSNPVTCEASSHLGHTSIMIVNATNTLEDHCSLLWISHNVGWGEEIQIVRIYFGNHGHHVLWVKDERDHLTYILWSNSYIELPLVLHLFQQYGSTVSESVCWDLVTNENIWCIMK